MTSLLIQIYNFFRRQKFLFYISLTISVLLMAYFAVQVKFEENVTNFLPDTEDTQLAGKVFENLKVKDKIIVMLSAVDTTVLPGEEEFINAADRLSETLIERLGQTHIEDIFYKVDTDAIVEARNFVYQNLPLFLTEKDYQHFDSLLQPEPIEAIMQKNYINLLSPAGIALKRFILEDPLGLGGNTLKHLQDFQLESGYRMTDGYIFSQDGSVSFMFITPVFPTGSTGENEVLINVLENEIEKFNKENQHLRIDYFGGPSVAVYNARQIKKDTILTTSIALVVIVVFISMVFKRKRAVPLIITPVLFGGLFALCLIYFIKGTISAIAVGSGSVVFGIALSYSIHMLAHQNHVRSIQQLIKDIAYPLTVGSFTTVGAFAGLLFTSSDLLRDFGLFASLALIGTTFFCLIYLPHFLRGQAHIEQGKVLSLIERINTYPFEKNKWLIGIIAGITILCIFTSRYAGFNENMSELSYEPVHLKQAENKLNDMFNKTDQTILFVTVGKNMEEASSNYEKTNQRLEALKQQGQIKDYASAQQFLIPANEQEKRLQQWKEYWTTEKKIFVQSKIREEARKYGFHENAFDGFYSWLNTSFETSGNDFSGEKADGYLLSEWQSSADSLTMLISQVRLTETNKDTVYQLFNSEPDVVVFDRGYFTNKWVSAVNDDFYLILYLSSFLVFFALLLSYGRIELTLISFLPMLISWVIIVGIMGLSGIQFNIVNIILATFIFGIGDDFSIFIMDGLQSKYRTGQRVLNSHKTAISFAAFTMIVGMGVLVFAKHPALQSISVISIVGMIVVVLVAYTIPPVFFHFFISNPVQKGLPPYTLTSVLRTLIVYIGFGLGCLSIGIAIILLTVIPLKKKRKKHAVCRSIHWVSRCMLQITVFSKKEKINLSGEKFDRPGIIIANHQSFIDIIVLLSLSPKIIMLTKDWVWNSPFFGFILRYVDFYHIADGYEQAVECLQTKVNEGYSIAIFPEGTRTHDGKMKRFHKGAFYLAETLKLDIIPVLLYGNYRILSKEQPCNIRKGLVVSKIMPRIFHYDSSWGKTYQERTKNISAYMRKEYARLCMEKDTPDNPYFYDSLIKNYIYKNPVEELYIRLQMKTEGRYGLLNEIIPRDADITDIGCGLGSLSFMLSLLSNERRINGIDRDADKIAEARHAWLYNEQMDFIHADALQDPLPESDVFILNEVLQDMDHNNQSLLLDKCAASLSSNGMIIVQQNNKKKKLNRLTEKLIRITGLYESPESNWTVTDIQMQQAAENCKLRLSIINGNPYKTIYLFRS
jgi:1-acyl-sn-glycerol-3-phosphate acyltransferase